MVERAQGSHVDNPPQVFTKDAVVNIRELPKGARVFLYVILDTMTTSDHGYEHSTIVDAGPIILKAPLPAMCSLIKDETTAGFSLQPTREQQDEFGIRERNRRVAITTPQVDEITETAKRAAEMKNARERKQRLNRLLTEAFLDNYPEVLAGKTLDGEVVDPATVNDMRFSVSLTGSKTPYPELFSYAKKLDFADPNGSMAEIE